MKIQPRQSHAFVNAIQLTRSFTCLFAKCIANLQLRNPIYIDDLKRFCITSNQCKFIKEDERFRRYIGKLCTYTVLVLLAFQLAVGGRVRLVLLCLVPLSHLIPMLQMTDPEQTSPNFSNKLFPPSFKLAFLFKRQMCCLISVLGKSHAYISV